MDFQQNIQNSPSPAQGKYSEHMALASMILGIVSAVTFGCIYLALICGSLGIILALLSRGAQMSACPQAKAGLALSCIGLILTITVYTIVFVFIMQQYGGIDGLLQEYMNLYNADTLEELYKNMGIY